MIKLSVLTSANLGHLRPMTESDLEQVLYWRNHPSIRSHMYTQNEISLDEHRVWWDWAKGARRSRYLIYELDGQSMGYVAFSEIVPEAGTANWGFYTAPDVAKGTGSLMALAAMDMAFGPLGLRKLSAEAIGRNAASIGLHESFGFQREGLFRAHVVIGGALVDVVRLALFADAWARLRPAKLQTLIERLSQ